MARIEIDVEASPGVVTGPGPITEITSFRTTNRLNQVGSWTMTLPATEPQADLLTAQATVIGYVIVNGERVFLGGGAIDNMRKRVDNTGRLTLTVSGVGLLGEGSREALEYLTLDDTGPNNLTALLESLPAPWIHSINQTSPDWQRAFVNETPLAAMVAVAKQIGARFANKPSTGGDIRHVRWYNGDPTGISLVCVMNLNALEAEDNPSLATIVSIEDISTSYEIINRVFVYGAGSGENQLTMAAATVWPDDTTDITDPYIAPSGDEYFFNLATNRITNADSFARLGDQLRSKRLQFPDITLLENSDLGLEIAANTLVKAAVAHLERHRSPQTVYRFKLADLRTRIYPGDLIRIDARRYIDGVRVVDIDAEVYVLSVTDVLDANGVWTADVEASDIPAWPEDTVTQLVQQAQTALVQQAHPQITGNVDTVTFRELLAGETPSFRVWVFLANETSLINDVRLRYHMSLVRLPLAESAPYTPSGGTHDYSAEGHIEEVTLMHSGDTNDTTSANPDTGHHHATLSVDSHVHYHEIDDHSLVYGYSTQDPDFEYAESQIEFNINGETSGGLVWRQGSLTYGTGATAWYELDITEPVRNATTGRPGNTIGADDGVFYIDARIELAEITANFLGMADLQVQVRTAIRQVATF